MSESNESLQAETGVVRSEDNILCGAQCLSGGIIHAGVDPALTHQTRSILVVTNRLIKYHNSRH